MNFYDILKAQRFGKARTFFDTLFAKPKEAIEWVTVSGSIISINDAKAYPAQSLKVSISPVQSGSGDPSPTNIRPISGWTGFVVPRTGVNVWDEEWELGTLDSSGNPSPSTTIIRAKNLIPIKAGSSYYKYNGGEGSFTCFWYDSNGDCIGSAGSNAIITAPSNAYYMRFRMSSGYGKVYNNNISINYPSTDISYHTYTGTTYQVEFPALTANLWDEEWVVSGSAIASKNNIPCVGGKWYYINVAPANGWRFYDANGNLLTTSYTNYTQAPDNAVSMWFKLGSAYGTTYNNDVIVAETTGSGVPVAYVPYTNTVYGGTLDLVSGEMVVDRVMEVFDGSDDEGWFVSSSSSLRYSFRGALKYQKKATSSAISDMLSNSIPLSTSSEGTQQQANNITCRSTSYLSSIIYIFTPPTEIDTVEELQDYLASSPLQIVYPLATPITYQLTPQQIQTLQGDNTIWADAGSVELTYAK